MEGQKTELKIIRMSEVESQEVKWLINRAFQREHWKMQRKNWASRQRKSITRGIGNWMQ